MTAAGRVVTTIDAKRIADAKREAALHAAATWVRLGVKATAVHETAMRAAIREWVLAESDAGRV